MHIIYQKVFSTLKLLFNSSPLLQKWTICHLDLLPRARQVGERPGLGFRGAAMLYWFSTAKKQNCLLLTAFSFWKNIEKLSPLPIVANCFSAIVCASCAASPQCKLQQCNACTGRADRSRTSDSQWSIPESVHDGHSQDTTTTILKYNYYNCTVIAIINTTAIHHWQQNVGTLSVWITK